MQETTGQQGNQNGQKQGGLSWTQSPAASNNPPQGGMKSVAQSASPLMPQKPAASSTNKNMPLANTLKKSETKQGGMGRSIGIFAGGIVVGLIVGWGWFSLGNNDTKVATTTGSVGGVAASSETTTSTQTTGSKTTAVMAPATDTTAVSSSASLGVDTQAAGLQVMLSSVSVSVPTWVAIFENNAGKTGNILGAALIFPGNKTGTVELLRATAAGRSYFAGEYVDNGDKAFSKQQDTQVMGVAGAPLLVEFNVR